MGTAWTSSTLRTRPPILPASWVLLPETPGLFLAGCRPDLTYHGALPPYHTAPADLGARLAQIPVGVGVQHQALCLRTRRLHQSSSESTSPPSRFALAAATAFKRRLIFGPKSYCFLPPQPYRRICLDGLHLRHGSDVPLGPCPRLSVARWHLPPSPMAAVGTPSAPPETADLPTYLDINFSLCGSGRFSTLPVWVV